MSKCYFTSYHTKIIFHHFMMDSNKNHKKIVESKHFYLDHIYLELVASSYNLDSNLGIQRVSILLHSYTEKNIILPIASKPKTFSKTTFQPILIKLKTFSK